MHDNSGMQNDSVNSSGGQFPFLLARIDRGFDLHYVDAGDISMPRQDFNATIDRVGVHQRCGVHVYMYVYMYI